MCFSCRAFTVGLVLIAFAIASRLSNGEVIEFHGVKLLSTSAASDLLDRLIAEFGRDNASEVDVHSGDSSYVVSSLRNAKCDAGLIVNSLASGDMLGPSFARFPFARFSIAVVVNSKAPVKSLTTEQLAEIFSGKTTSWSKMLSSNQNQPIELYSPLLGLTSSYVFRRTAATSGFALALHDRSKKPWRQKHHIDGIIGAVIKHSGGIGFFQLGPEMIVDKRVRLVAVGDTTRQPVTPTAETIAAGSYFLTDQLSLYLHPDAPQSAREFCEFATGPDGARIIRKFDLWPEYELESERGKQRATLAAKGKGSSVSVIGIAEAGKLAEGLGLHFSKSREAVQIKYQKERSREEAEEAIRKGEADLLLAEGSMQRAEGARHLTIGYASLGVIVHPELGLKRLPIEELRQICAGEVREWPGASSKGQGNRGKGQVIKGYGLPSDAAVMRLYQRIADSGSRIAQGNPKSQKPNPKQIQKTKTQHSRTLTPDPSPIKGEGRHARVVPLKLTKCKDTAAVILAVARDPAGIGFVDLSQMPGEDKSVGVVEVIGTGSGHR